MNLKKKVGPLPVWGWLGAVALGVVILYWRKHNASGTGMTSAANPSPILDPTQGDIPSPSGLSSGGTMPDGSFAPGSSPGLAQELNDLGMIQSLIPAPAPGEPQQATSGAQEVTDVVGIIKALQEGELISNNPATSTGSATSTAQKHTKSKPPVDRVNKKSGEHYRVVHNPAGKPTGTYHVYEAGKKKRFVKVGK